MSVARQEIRTGLDALFLPDSVAVIGATERTGTVGRTILENLLHPSFRGKVFAVNSRHSEICGLKAYPTVADVPEKVDLAGEAYTTLNSQVGIREHRYTFRLTFWELFGISAGTIMRRPINSLVSAERV